ncbi:hypothetical protein E2320_005966, partial [Naja naja]
MNYDICKVYMARWGIQGKWMKPETSRWIKPTQDSRQVETQAHSQPASQPSQAAHTLKGEALTPPLMSFPSSTAWGSLPDPEAVCRWEKNGSDKEADCGRRGKTELRTKMREQDIYICI